MKIALLTFYSPHYQKVADLTSPGKDEYCAKNNYIHIKKIGPHRRPDLYYAIDRLFYLYDILFDTPESDYLIPDVIWVLNVQSVITNYNKKIEDLLDDEHDFYISPDVGGLNAGSFIVKKSEWSQKWIDVICALAPNVNHCHWEQTAMQHLHIREEFRPKIKILKQTDLNSYDYNLYRPNWNENTLGHWHSGDLAISLPGLTIDRRMELIPEWLNKVVK